MATKCKDVDLSISMEDLLDQVRCAFSELESCTLEERVDAINRVREITHEYSPFKQEPVDCVIWVPFDQVAANDYNPNQVAPPEMELLVHSIRSDGYTQPIVTWTNDGEYEVVDGFHRHRVGREQLDIAARIHGFLPVTVVNTERTDRGDRIASTIRHNRARGKHMIDGMAEIVLELKRRNWSDKKIGRDLGMDPDEVLRLSQITGLAEMFADKQFSEAWEADTSVVNMEDRLDVESEDV